MAKLGALKPLRGTASGLANIILQEGEIAFDYLPSGTYGDYGIKMGDGSTKYSSLPYLIKRSKTAPWEYDEGNDEAALLHNIEHPVYETIGKIYYIQSYMNDGNQYREGTPTIQQEIPYKVIGVNHDGTSNTVDLMSCVAVNYLRWNSRYNNLEYGRYSTSNLYDWVKISCRNGYSSNIKAKMFPMIERWREATGNNTGTLQTRSTKCKLLNPVELFGTSAASYTVTWRYGSTSDHTTKFLSDNYGSQYPIWDDSISSLTSRRIYHNKAMSTASDYWTNSWLAYDSSSTRYACCFSTDTNGACGENYVPSIYGVAPVIRLSVGYSDWQYDEGTDEAALLNNIKHPEYEQIGKIYYIQSYMNAGNLYTEDTPIIQQDVPYMVIGVNHEGTTNTVDLQAMFAVNYLKFNDSSNDWSYGRYTTSKLYNWVGSTCQNGYSSNIQAKMVSMTERWREATGNRTGVLKTRSTKCKLLNPFELFGSSIESYIVSGAPSGSDFTQYDYGQHYSAAFLDNIISDPSRVRRHNATSQSCQLWTNSYYYYYSGACCFTMYADGSCRGDYSVISRFGLAPVIRLQG